MPATRLTRRASLRWIAATAAGVSLLPARLALAAPVGPAAPDGPRLVVVMLRGALDGLAAVPVPGDPAWAGLRASAEPQSPPPLSLGGPFALHPALGQLHQWYGQGQLLVLHAVASAYRERSHFDAQQMVESGGTQPFALSTGWLGRALQASGQAGVALVSALPLALRGGDGASTWTPSRNVSNREDLMARVAEMYRHDPALQQAFAQSMDQQSMASGGVADGAFKSLARQAGVFLAAPNGPRVAWLDTGGWDTHTQQAPRLARLLANLDEGLAALREALASQWARTTVLVFSEFGRSVAFNGSGGTDHGTGGVAFLAGGAVAGGRVLADWPGLGRQDLLDGRDLRPTQDLRVVIGAVLQRQFQFDPARLSGAVLPGVAMATQAYWHG